MSSADSAGRTSTASSPARAGTELLDHHHARDLADALVPLVVLVAHLEPVAVPVRGVVLERVERVERHVLGAPSLEVRVGDAELHGAAHLRSLEHVRYV